MTIRSTIASLVVLCVPVLACSVTPGDSEQTGQSAASVIYKRYPPTLAQCEAFLPACTVTPSSWAAATPAENGDPVATRYADAWILELQYFGCTTPVVFDNPPVPHSNVELTMCPASAIAELPSPANFLLCADPINPNAPYANLEMGCNACFPYGAPAGYVFLAWAVESDSPGGCKNGSCSGLSQ